MDGKAKNMHLEQSPDKILSEIQQIVLQQQADFADIWEDVRQELEKEKIYLVTEKKLNKDQQRFVQNLF